MKTAISIPDAVFEEAERMARRMKRSRSDLYSRALADYLARHSSDRVTEAMDRTLSVLASGAGKGDADKFVESASRKVLERSEW
jgi:metal-responsive CopG/Arc/MetJ family transcriptional regulator